MALRFLPAVFTLTLPVLLALAASPSSAHARPGYHPYAPGHRVIRRVDLSAEAALARRDARGVLRGAERDWAVLDEVESIDSHRELDRNPPVAGDSADAGHTPEGWVQRGGVVLPAAVASGDVTVNPDVAFAIEDIPGNAYPRKHTLYLNFVGADMIPGADNSALNKSMLARLGPYPAYTGGDQKALSIAQAVAEDVAAYGIIVRYLPQERPSDTVPYTMEMVGGNWMDTNIDSPAGGVAPGADCGALGQRHVVYAFASGGLGVNTAANTVSQEAGHAWGLDHTNNCGSVMSYCGVANGGFSNTCDSLCEASCQGPNSAGCRLTHDNFCGEGNDQQNEDAELTFLFGGNEPDVEPPFVNIISPVDGVQLQSAVSVDLRAEVGDNYGGFGWKYIITRNGEVMFDEVAFDRQIDNDYRAALNLVALEDGLWTITVEVEDQFEQVTSQTVTFQVGDEVAVFDTGDESMGDTAESSSGSDGGSDGRAQDGGDTRGCDCRTGGRPRSPAGMALAGLLVAVLTRRRGLPACAR